MTTSRKNKALLVCQLFMFFLAAVCICYGVGRGEVPLLFKKAVRICMECIGLG